jgi:hypothetical protein
LEPFEALDGHLGPSMVVGREQSRAAHGTATLTYATHLSKVSD